MKVKVKCKFPKLCKYPHTEDGDCDKWCSFNTKEIFTHADAIRAMTDEELAEFILNGDVPYFTIYTDALTWLQQEHKYVPDLDIIKKLKKIKCDECKYYNWYYDRCNKWSCEVDARAIHPECFIQ